MHFVVIDDHPLYLEAISEQISRTFENSEVHPFPSLEEALSFLDVSGQKIDMVLMDYSMPGTDGIDGVKSILSAAGDVPIALLSGVAKPAEVNACIEAGARGFFTKTMDARVLNNAISVVLYGGTYLPIEYTASKNADSSDGGAMSPDNFTERDIALLRMLSEGNSNKEIARHLNLQEVTVKFYLSRLFRQMGVKNRAQAAVKATNLGIISTPDA